ncbi:polysaccharide biosynthesis C-terminal domain-containing protein, partial [Candidatus Bathyarchaeota archaeon]|nr:polysaccharide biosynthesis C-terminal domain-containing protein [Candidatus Bathyarchaeota archaeon]
LSATLYLFTGLGYGVTINLLNGAGETKQALKAYLAYLTVFAAAAPILTWQHSIPGLIAANLTAYLTLTLYAFHLARRKFNIKINLKEQARIYLASALSTLPTLAFLNLSTLPNLPNLIIGATLCLFTYLTLTPILKAISPQDLQNLKQIFERIKIIWPIAKPILNYEQKILQNFKSPNQS